MVRFPLFRFGLIVLIAPIMQKASADDIAPILRARALEEQSQRRVASLDTEDRAASATRVKARRRAATSKELKLHLGILAGISSLKTDGDSQTNALFGLTLDVREYRYFGLEAESYYAFPAKKTSEQTKDLGVLLNAKGQLPLLLAGVRLVPKLGVGYGLVRTTSSRDAVSEEDQADSDTVSLNGPYAMAGLEIEPIANVILMADYLMSISAKGSLKSNGFSSATSLSNVKIERIRANLLYRFQKNVLAGAQYTRRTSRYDLGVIFDSAVSASSAVNQIQALLILEL